MEPIRKKKNKNFVDCDGVLIESYIEKEIYYVPQQAVRIGSNRTGFMGTGFIKSGRDIIKQVVLPETITDIGAHSFSRCENLEDINFPSKLEWIGVEAFSYCRKLNAVVLPDSLKKIAHSAFFCCEKISTVKIPQGVSAIQRNTFSGCKALETVVLHDKIKEIGGSAFINTKIKNICFPLRLKTIGCGAFANTLLEEIHLPPKLTKIERNTFSSCKINQIIIPENIKSIEAAAFENCKELENVYIPDLTTVSDTAFRGCDKVTIYSGKNSHAEEYAKKNGIPFVEVPSLKYVSMVCQKDRVDLLKYVIDKQPVPNWLFDFLIEGVVKQNNCPKCNDFLIKQKSENL